MPWDVRRSKRYYYRPQRLQGQPRRIYLGSGRVAKAAAEADERLRLARQAAANKLAAEEAQLRETEASLAELCAAAHVLGRACLVADGLHQHSRGEWRRRRRWQEPTDLPDPRTGPDPETAADPREVLGALARMSSGAEGGDPAELGKLRRVLDRSPGVWQAVGELARQVEATLIELACGTNLLLAECLRLRLQALKDELGGRSPAERLLGQCLTATGIWVYYLDALTIQYLDALTTQDGSRPRVRLLLSLGGAAHRRHSANLWMLMRLRRLLRPPPTAFGLAGRPDRAPPRPVAAARASPQQAGEELTAAR
jgi:hypothetical protein